jgi:hypothetical protein
VNRIGRRTSLRCDLRPDFCDRASGFAIGLRLKRPRDNLKI